MRQCQGTCATTKSAAAEYDGVKNFVLVTGDTSHSSSGGQQRLASVGQAVHRGHSRFSSCQPRREQPPGVNATTGECHRVRHRKSQGHPSSSTAGIFEARKLLCNRACELSARARAMHPHLHESKLGGMGTSQSCVTERIASMNAKPRKRERALSVVGLMKRPQDTYTQTMVVGLLQRLP
ncbi:hypothetical protein NDU88_008529 [Pleurodeles waltl]|uniref:Uncharacterized protein n=1 Tax=Pleurodeles waltl TaxID=8319 RepID=A0AAV7RSN5_PLEWA|nr:hypothetical protein NDU88_008529 [Pleurodeles waltl]